MQEAPSLPLLPAEPSAIIDAVLRADRRVLFLGQPGTGKSTLVRALAGALGETGRTSWCIGADPGSPQFGVPGAVCLGRWHGEGWALARVEALCTLDAGRFRLPLVGAVARLVQRMPAGVLLLDGPGVVRGIAGAELLSGIAQAAAIEVVVVLAREGSPVPLAAELAALPVEAVAVRAASGARRPGERARAKARTALWDAYLAAGRYGSIALAEAQIIGTPPPVHAAAAWTGRQIALLDGDRTIAMGEVTALEAGVLRARLQEGAGAAATLLVRDAGRFADGRLGTSIPFTADRLEYLPSPDIAPRLPTGTSGGPRVTGRVGVFSVSLVNGVFGDPLLHVRLRHARRSLLFDLGEGSRLPARVAHQVSDVFITHAHIDHIAGFLWLLRSRIGDLPVCRMYGPPGLAGNIDGLTRGILWDRVADRGPRFDVMEMHGDRVVRHMVQAGRAAPEALGERPTADGLLLSEPGFRVRAVTLEHVSPVLAFALEPAQQANVRKDRLLARALAPGPWLGEVKRHLHSGQREALVALPNGCAESVASLAADLILVSPGKKLVYATDFRDSEENRRRLVALARGAHTLFCEATFLEQDAMQAARTAHLTTRACAGIAREAGVARLVPFHFSRRYEDSPARIYEEIAEICPAVAVPRSMGIFEERDEGARA
jgi:ribonuclease Z